jgi:hypothetical protein
MMATTTAGRTASGVMSTSTTARALAAGGGRLRNSGPGRHKKHQANRARAGRKLPNAYLVHVESSLTSLNRQMVSGVPRRDDYNIAMRQRTRILNKLYRRGRRLDRCCSALRSVEFGIAASPALASQYSGRHLSPEYHNGPLNPARRPALAVRC